MNVLEDAIQATAGIHEGRATASDRSVARTRATIARFLENAPAELTVLEMRQMLEEMPD